MVDEELQKEIRRRHSRTFEVLLNKYSKLLWTVASGVLKDVGSQGDIEDCVAES